ncbi:nibrin-like [Mytilus trossulus]|uniref:nibrin-like n=1 Tax=Mytilus trossulus TaxID=6551 RepID=UPI00300567E1
MWYLISLDNPDVKYTLLTKHTYLIGRKNCDILIAGDAAVSRNHAQIELVHKETDITNPEKLPTVSLTDLSKFGTSVNGDKIKNIELKDGDLVTFGNSSTFTLVYEPFIISSSCLDPPSKKKVREWICILGGHMVNDWKKECTLLVMNNISVTIKVVCALLSLKNIVTPDYLEKYIKFLRGESGKPDPDLFLPVITETQVETHEVSFKVVPKRRNIFQGMKFIFLNEKQFKKMNLAVELGGGLPVLLEEKWQKDTLLVEKGSVVMQCEPNQCTQMMSQDSNNWVLHVQAFLRKHKKHMIQDAEIGFAVLYCSTEKHCNPNTDNGDDPVLRHVPSQSVSNTDVLVANTEVSPDRSPTRVRKKKCETVLDETKFDKQDKTPAKTLMVKQESSQTKSTSQEQTTDSQRSKRSTKRGRIDEEEVIQEVTTPLKKKVKQEIVTPVQSQNESRNLRMSQRRSPSPVSRSSPRKQRNISPKNQTTSQRSPSPKSKRQNKTAGIVKKEIIEDSDDEIESKSKHHVIVDDSDDEFPDFRSKKKPPKQKSPKTSSANSDDGFPDFHTKTKGKQPKAASESINVSDSDEEFHVGKPRSSQRKPVKHEASPAPRSKSKHMGDGDADNNELNNTGANVMRTSKRKTLVEDSEEEIDVQPKGKKRQVIENSDDEFDRLISKKKKPQTSSVADEDNTVSTVTHGTGKFVVPEDKKLNHEEIKTEVAEPQTGFISAAEENLTRRPTDYVKEEDLPSRCINIQFVDLVARKPNKPKKQSSEGVPEGYVKWKGKLVRSYKKFRKTENAGANSLPRIIGGSDLIAHTATNRKDLDDWFKEAIQAESQTNESEKKAQDLFNWEPNKKRSR